MRWWGLWMVGVLALACGLATEGVPEAPGKGEPWRVEEEPEQAGEPDAAAWRTLRTLGVSQPELRPRPTGLRGPAVAYDGELYLVVWADERTGGVFGARVKADGTLLDEAGLALNVGTEWSGGAPAVAYDGHQFVVVWRSSDGVFGTHVRRDGSVRDESFVLLFSDEVGGRPDIACGGGVCLVNYLAFGDDEAVVFASRLDGDGQLLGSVRLSPGGDGQYAGEPSVAYDGEHFLVVWSDSRGGGTTPDVYGARVRLDGTVLDEDGRPLIVAPGAQQAPAVVWTGKRYLLVWEDDRSGDWDVYGARVHTHLKVKEPRGFPIATGEGAQRGPRVAHTGSKSLVVWSDTRLGPQRIRGARVKDNGTVADPDGFALSSGAFPEEFLPDVVAGNHRFFVSFSGSPDGIPHHSQHVLGMRVKHDTRVSEALVLTRSVTAQASPAAAYGAGMYLVVWREHGEEGPQLLAVRVGVDGQVLGTPVRLPASPEAHRPAVAYGGGVFLVVWEEADVDWRGDIRGARVDASGSLMDDTPLAISVNTWSERAPAVASSGSDFLVVWEDARDTFFGNVSDIFGARVSGGGTVLDAAGFRISDVVDTQFGPAVVRAGDHYFVAWRDFQFVPVGRTETRVRGARVTDAGGVLDTPPLLLHTGPVTADPMALSAGAGQVLVVWTDSIFLPGQQVLAARVGAGGALLDAEPRVLATGPGTRGAPTAVFDGDVHRVVWEQGPPESSLGVHGRTDLYGARVRPDGTVLEVGGVPVARNLAPEFEPVLVSPGDGRAAVFFTEFVHQPGVMNLRVRGRLLGE